MRLMNWIAIFIAAIIISCCFFTWVEVPGRNIFIGGFRSNTNAFGSPGILHSFFCGACIILFTINRIWSVRTAFFMSVINIAWAFRNFLLISACTGGDCPIKQPAIYVLLASSIGLMVAILFIRPGAKDVMAQKIQNTQREK
ncbi:MAG: hypothetical protein ACJ749_00015 [Flavisolibacter sp.]